MSQANSSQQSGAGRRPRCPTSPARSLLNAASPFGPGQPSSPALSQVSGLSRLARSTRSVASKEQMATDRSDFSEMFHSSPLHYGSESHFNMRSSSAHGNISAFRNRVDIQTENRNVRQINLNEEEPMDQQAGGDQLAPASSQSGNPHLVIWGTDVSISDCKEKFKRFLYFDGFDVNDLDPEEQQLLNDVGSDSDMLRSNKSLYMQKLEEIFTLEDPFLNVNCGHIYQFNRELYRKLVSYPQEVIPAFDMAVNEIFFEIYPNAELVHPINIRPYNVMETHHLRSLNPEDINQLKTIAGMVIRCSTVIPEMREAFFQCSVCGAVRTCEVDRGRIAEPSLCTNCNTNYSFQIVHNRSKFIDKQQIKLQESPDEMPAGQTPYTILLYACADLVDAVQPGDRVTVTGIYRATPVRENPRQRNVKSVYRTHIDVVHYRKLDNKRLHEENKLFHFSSERIDKLKAFSRLPDIYERLANAIAPSIYELEDIKKGVLLQLFGGTKKQPTAEQIVRRRHFRSEINILLCGDPGTSKSQLLRYVFQIVPRAQYTSGKGSSAVGLTAYITKDPDSRQLVLQTGALVLADGGICCIDEFDKMSEATRSILHEVMEQQTLSIAKAGIVCQLNARTSVLAAANPVESQWNKNKTIIENIQLPHTLISR